MGNRQLGKPTDIHAAKKIALKYLSRAPRSVREVELKLKEKNIGENAIEETINYLLGLGYLNDELLAKQWAGSKIRFRLWGKNRIIQGLKQKGIAEEIVKEVIGNSRKDELNTAKTALEKWIKKQGQGSGGKGQEKLKLQQKAFRHLHSKGFATAITVTVIKEKFGEAETDEDI